nr:hypothetical protein [uncultured Ruminococcus sp.]
MTTTTTTTVTAAAEAAKNPLHTMLKTRYTEYTRADGTTALGVRAPRKADFVTAGCAQLYDAYKTALAGVAAAINHWATTPSDSRARSKAVDAMQAACDVLRRAADIPAEDCYTVKPITADWLRAVSVADATSAKAGLLGVARVKSDAALSRSLTTVACCLAQHVNLRIDMSKDEAKRRAKAAEAAENAKFAKNEAAEAAAAKAAEDAKREARNAKAKERRAAAKAAKEAAKTAEAAENAAA